MKYSNLFFSQSCYFLIEAYLLYNVVLMSDSQQSDSVIHVYVCIYTVCMYTHIILFIVYCYNLVWTVHQVGLDP